MNSINFDKIEKLVDDLLRTFIKFLLQRIYKISNDEFIYELCPCPNCPLQTAIFLPKVFRSLKND